MKSRVVAVIPARLDSQRLPGKHLLNMAGRPVLHYLVERLKSVKSLDEVVVATTERECDLPLVEWAEKHNIASFCGSTDDVLGRFLGAARHYRADLIVRANGDNPLLAPEVIEQGLEQIVSEKLDFVTGKNRYTKFPIGIGAEMITMGALERLERITITSDYREHITTYIFDNPADFQWAPVYGSPGWIAPSINLTLDTILDFQRIERAVQALLARNVKPEAWTIEDIISAYERPEE